MNLMEEDIKKYGSDYIIDVLIQHGIEYVACNPGSTFRGLHDSLVNYPSNKKPTLVLCCHEEIAVAVAHGYAKASGKYMAVFIHSNVGLQHASMAIFNAWCDRVPMLILGGIGPMDSLARRPWIDWIHTSNYHPNIINDYVKWHDQPQSLGATMNAIYRACRLTSMEPKAPVYLGIDVAIQEKTPSSPPQLMARQLVSPALPAPDTIDLDMLANDLIHAKFPIILVDHLGRNPKAVSVLVKLAELLAIPVYDCAGRYNFPNTHFLYLISPEQKLLKKADLVLAFEVQDLTGALLPFTDCKNIKVTHVTMADFLVSKWAADYHEITDVNCLITADSFKVISMLLGVCEGLLTKTQILRNNRRKIFLEDLHVSLRKKSLSAIRNQAESTPMSSAFALLKIGEVLQDENFCLVNHGSVNDYALIRKSWSLSKENCCLGFSGGAGLGYGLGASIGATLALHGSGKLCVNVQSDGDFLFTPSALWTISHLHLPILILVMNNGGYLNTWEHSMKIAKHRGRPIERAHLGSSLSEPDIDFSGVAKSFGIDDFFSVDSECDLISALKDAISIVKNGKPALVDIKVK